MKFSRDHRISRRHRRVEAIHQGYGYGVGDSGRTFYLSNDNELLSTARNADHGRRLSFIDHERIERDRHED
jgi:hypothetical protein